MREDDEAEDARRAGMLGHGRDDGDPATNSTTRPARRRWRDRSSVFPSRVCFGHSGHHLSSARFLRVVDAWVIKAGSATMKADGRALDVGRRLSCSPLSSADGAPRCASAMGPRPTGRARVPGGGLDNGPGRAVLSASIRLRCIASARAAGPCSSWRRRRRCDELVRRASALGGDGPRRQRRPVAAARAALADNRRAVYILIRRTARSLSTRARCRRASRRPLFSHRMSCSMRASMAGGDPIETVLFERELEGGDWEEGGKWVGVRVPRRE